MVYYRVNVWTGCRAASKLSNPCFTDFLSRASIFKRKGMERNVNFLDLQWTSILFKGDSQSALFDQFTQLTDSMQFYYWQSLGLSISNPNQPKVKIYLGYKIIIIINCEHPHYVRWKVMSLHFWTTSICWRMSEFVNRYLVENSPCESYWVIIDNEVLDSIDYKPRELQMSSPHGCVNIFLTNETHLPWEMGTIIER